MKKKQLILAFSYFQPTDHLIRICFIPVIIYIYSVLYVTSKYMRCICRLSCHLTGIVQ